MTEKGQKGGKTMVTRFKIEIEFDNSAAFVALAKEHLGGSLKHGRMCGMSPNGHAALKRAGIVEED